MLGCYAAAREDVYKCCPQINAEQTELPICSMAARQQELLDMQKANVLARQQNANMV